MAAFTITVEDQGVQALLQRLSKRAENLQPALQAIGDDIVERAKGRFASSTGPDGEKWKDNAPSTLGILSARLGKSYRKKSGDLNAAGARRLAGKKPLIGESRDLSRHIVAIASASASEVTVRSSPVYAAIHQFGGKAGSGLKVTIPARPFLPVRQDGILYPKEREEIIAAINDLLLDLP